MRADAELAGRVVGLDERPVDPACQGLCADLAHFIRVLEEVVPPGQLSDPVSADALAAAQADRAQRRCRLLERVAASAPELTDGPLDLTAQYWIGTSDTQGGAEPRESSFIPAAAASVPSSGAKPFGVGLFTSTGNAATYGMWRCFLPGYECSDSLHRMPWHTWRLQPRQGIRVYEVRDAAAWVGLVTAYPRVHSGYVYPDWAAVAAVYDAIHVTLRAITAVEGLSFVTGYGPSAAPYWTVESTLWLNWCFDAAELVEVTRRGAAEQETAARSDPERATEFSAPPLSTSLPPPAVGDRRAR